MFVFMVCIVYIHCVNVPEIVVMIVFSGCKFLASDHVDFQPLSTAFHSRYNFFLSP